MLSTILETLGNFKLEENTYMEIVDKIFEIYGIINEKDLHMVVKFVIKACIVLKSKDILMGKSGRWWCVR